MTGVDQSAAVDRTDEPGIDWPSVLGDRSAPPGDERGPRAGAEATRRRHTRSVSEEVAGDLAALHDSGRIDDDEYADLLERERQREEDELGEELGDENSIENSRARSLRHEPYRYAEAETSFLVSRDRKDPDKTNDEIENENADESDSETTRDMVRRVREGRVDVYPIALPDLSALTTLSPVDRKAWNFIVECWTARFAHAEDRPLPCSIRFLAEEIGCSPKTAHRVLGRLQEAGLIWWADTLEPLGGRGTHCYLPGRPPTNPFADGDRPRVRAASDLVPEAMHEGPDLAIEVVGTDPLAEAPHEPLVADTELAATGELGGSAAAGYRASSEVVHAEQGYAASRPAWTAHEQAMVFLNRYVAEAKIGTRNATGLKLACQLRDLRLEIDEAAPYMALYVDAVPQDGQDAYTEREAIRTLESAYSRPPRPPARRTIEPAQNGAHTGVGAPSAGGRS